MDKLRILVVSVNRTEEEVRIIKLARVLEKLGHTVHYFHLKTKAKGSRRRLGVAGKFRFVSRIIRASLAMREYDVIHLLDIGEVFYLPFLLNRTPKVFDARTGWGRMLRQCGIGLKWRVLGWIADRFTSVMVRYSNHTTISDPRTAQQILGMKPKRWSFLRNLPLRGRFLPQKRKREIIRFGYAGMIAENRGLDTLLRAWKILLRYCKNVELVIAGWFSSDKYRNSLLGLFKQENIMFLGELEFRDMPEFYSSLDVFVVPTTEDYWSLRIGEALASRIPVIMSNTPLHRMIADNGVVLFSVLEGVDSMITLSIAMNIAVRDIDRLRGGVVDRVVPFWDEEVAKLVTVYEQIRRKK